MRSSLALLLLITFLSGCEISELSKSTPTANVTLTWEVPVARENEDPLYIYEIGGYEIAYRKIGTDIYQTVQIDQGDIDSFTLTDIVVGEYEFKIAVFDSNGLYSQYSDTAIFQIGS